MKQTRKLAVRDRVFGLADMERIAAIFAKQQQLARKSNHQASAQFEIKFSDDTSLEADSSDVLCDMLNGPARPASVRFLFANYDLDRCLGFDADLSPRI